MLSSGPSRSPATPKMRKPHVDDTMTREGLVPENSSLEERMQYMIDMQYAYTESFRQDQDGPIVVDDLDASTANNANGNGNGDTNSMNNNDHELPPYPQTDVNVGRGQLIFSNTYYQQQHLHLLPPSPSMNQPYRPQPMYEGYNAIDTTLSMVDTDPDHLTDDQRFLEYLNNAHDPNKTNYHNDDDCCCCLWDPIIHSLRYLMHADSLHRSFCYAAIDGMLTGAGLVATLVGFAGPLAHTTAATTSAAATAMTTPSPWMVAVCFTACTADALCMAVSHVWNTHVVSTLAAREHRDERLAFSRNRNESKAKLVDRLLSRGMLKIDAVSIADTLEGYPDIFVGALVGDAVVGMPQEHENDDNTYPLAPGYNNHNGGMHNPRTQAENYRSYGQFREWDHDPDAAVASAAVAESQTEAMVMAAAFSMFGTLPAAMYYGASCWVVLLSLSNSNNNDNSDIQQSISARSAAMTLGCTIIWFLGVWKR